MTPGKVVQIINSSTVLIYFYQMYILSYTLRPMWGIMPSLGRTCVICVQAQLTGS
jgi:hypothetical protein